MTNQPEFIKKSLESPTQMFLDYQKGQRAITFLEKLELVTAFLRSEDAKELNLVINNFVNNGCREKPEVEINPYSDMEQNPQNWNTKLTPEQIEVLKNTLRLKDSNGKMKEVVLVDKEVYEALKKNFRLEKHICTGEKPY